MSRATLLAELGEVLERLGDDEIAVLHLVTTRVLAGQRSTSGCARGSNASAARTTGT